MDDQFEVVLLSKVALIRCDFQARAARSHSDTSWIELWDRLNSDLKTRSVVCLVNLGSLPERNLYPIGPKAAGMRKPFVLGVDGYISGPIHELVGQADVVVASDTSTVGPPGTIMPLIGNHSVRGLPHQELTRLLLLQSTETMTVERGRELGLIDYVVTSDRLKEATIDRARRLVVD